MKKIPEGYKETELGVIPQEWEVKEMKEISLETQLGINIKSTIDNINQRIFD